MLIRKFLTDRICYNFSQRKPNSPLFLILYTGHVIHLPNDYEKTTNEIDYVSVFTFGVKFQVNLYSSADCILSDPLKLSKTSYFA